MTRGNATSMTMAGWDKACAARRHEAEEEQDIGNRKVIYKTVCLDCPGEIPAEVTIIELSAAAATITTGKIDMAKNGQRKTAKCEWCGEVKMAKTINGKVTCTICEIVCSSIRLRPQAVIDTIRAIAPELLTDAGSGGDIATLQESLKIAEANHESAQLQIDELQQRLNDYEASDLEVTYEKELLDIRAALRADNDEDLVEVAQRRMATMAKLEESYLQKSQALADTQSERDDLKRQLAASSGEATLCVSATCRQAMHDLALRLAIGVLKGEIEGIGAADVELLRSC